MSLSAKNERNIQEDNIISFDYLNKILRSEVFRTISSYLEFEPEKLFTDLFVDEKGSIVFRCKIYAQKIKPIGLIEEKQK